MDNILTLCVVEKKMNGEEWSQKHSKDSPRKNLLTPVQPSVQGNDRTSPKCDVILISFLLLIVLLGVVSVELLTSFISRVILAPPTEAIDVSKQVFILVCLGKLAPF